MQPLNLPTYSFNIKSAGTGSLIFDTFRRRWVALTPEEWVRQNMAHYLAGELGYPESLILIEGKISLNKLVKRCDLIVYNRKGKPVMLAEFKSPDVQIGQNVFDQIGRYNLALEINYLLVSNGLNHYCLQLDGRNKTFTFLTAIPHYDVLSDQSSRVI